jgi:hypothetical protein
MAQIPPINSRCDRSGNLINALEVEQQLPANGVNHCSAMAKCKARPGTDETCFKQRIRHSRDSFHSHYRVPDGSCRDVVLAEDAQSPQLAKVLEGVALLLGNQSGSLPPQQLAATYLQDAQHVLTAITGHSGVLLPPGYGPSRSAFGLDLTFCTRYSDSLCPAQVLDLVVRTAT